MSPLFFLRENLKLVFKHSAIPIFLVLATIVLVVYSLSFPSYLAMKQASAQMPPWSATVDFESKNRSELNALREDLSTEFAPVEIVNSCRTEALVSADKRSLNEANEAPQVLTEALLLEDFDKKHFPADVYIPADYVISGNPYDGEGLLLEAALAQDLGVKAGDSIYVGLKYPHGSDEAQNVLIPGMSPDEADSYAIDVVYREIKVSALVKQGSFVDGIALLQPKESVAALEDEICTSVTELFLFGPSQDKIMNTWRRIQHSSNMEGVYLTPASETYQYHQKEFMRENGGVKTFVGVIIVGSAIAFLLLVLDGLWKQQKLMHAFAVLVALGAPKKKLIVSQVVSALFVYGVLILIGCFAGSCLSRIAYPIWIPSEIKQMVFAAAGLIVLGAVLCQSIVLALRVKRLDIAQSFFGETE